VISTRYAVNKISGFPLSTLDIRYMAEMAQFLGLSACGIVLFKKYMQNGRAKIGSQSLGRVDVHELALCLSFIAIGFHLGNYFWSGVGKLSLGPKPWSWVLENQTQNMTIVALKRGVLPSGAFPWVTQGLFDSFGTIAPLSNVLVLTTQLFSVIAVLRVTWLRIASLAYDGLHIGIFLLGGLFFWQWIWNNLSIMVSVHRRSDQEIGWAPKVCCVITILLGFSASLGASARLAWWDVADIKIPIIQAQAENGVWIDVPVSYFLSHSYAISHGYVDLAVTEGHYLPTIWGSAYTYDRPKTSGTCSKPPYIAVTESQGERAERLERVGTFVRAHHRKLLRRVDENGFSNFYLRLNHHPSNPWMHKSFNNLDLRKIRRYRLLTQSVCLSMSDGRLIQRIIKEDATTFNVDE
jgi:hypothetical protein